MRRRAFDMTRWLIVLAALAMLSACQNSTAQSPTPAVQVGMQAPPIDLTTVQGEGFRLGDRPTLLAFLNTQADDSTTPDPSRSQIVFLKSMDEQYAGDIEVVIVDASAVMTGSRSDPDSLTNFVYDWSLDSIPVLVDSEGEVAQAYGVASLPTTFLIGADGVIRQRWGGFASAPQLDMAVQEAFGLNMLGTPIAADQCAATPAQAMFAGLPLARPLSDQIWVVDSGETWAEGVLMRWLILAPAGESLNLRVAGSVMDVSRFPIVVNASLTPLPDDESEVLSTHQEWSVYEFAAPVPELLNAPCLQLEAVVVNASGDEISTGEAIVPMAGIP